MTSQFHGNPSCFRGKLATQSPCLFLESNWAALTTKSQVSPLASTLQKRAPPVASGLELLAKTPHDKLSSACMQDIYII